MPRQRCPRCGYRDWEVHCTSKGCPTWWVCGVCETTAAFKRGRLLRWFKYLARRPTDLDLEGT